jgi:hypothetical protein
VLATTPDGLVDLCRLTRKLTSKIQHQVLDMNTDPISTEAPLFTESVPIQASADTPPMSQPAADEETMPTVEIANAEVNPDGENICTYSLSV